MAVADVLSDATNAGVVQMPGRAFPGVVLQGDSFAILIGDIEAVALQGDAEEREAVLADVLERLKGLQTHYETVLHRLGIQLPYVKS